MSDFFTKEQVEALFQSAGCVGAENHYFVAIKDTTSQPATMMGGMVGGMIQASTYPYDGWLVNMTETGFGIFYLKQDGFSLTAPKVEKMVLDPQSYNFIPFTNVKKIKVSNYALLNSKIKKAKIDLADGRDHFIYANVAEKAFAYQQEGFAAFLAKFGK